MRGEIVEIGFAGLVPPYRFDELQVRSSLFCWLAALFLSRQATSFPDSSD